MSLEVLVHKKEVSWFEDQQNVKDSKSSDIDVDQLKVSLGLVAGFVETGCRLCTGVG